MLLNLSHIYKDYQQEKLVVPVLKDVSLSVEEGEYVAIMDHRPENHIDEYYRVSGSANQRKL